MALWFAGNYSDDAVHSWGMMTSSDNGATWTQTTIESELTKDRLADGTLRCLSRRWQDSRRRTDRGRERLHDASPIPDGIDRLRCDVDAIEDKHWRCHGLHAEP